MDEKHPFRISIAENPPMKAWDLVINVGNFKSQADADAFAGEVVKFLEENGNAWSARAQ